MPFKLNKKENLIYIGIIGTICSRKSQELFITNIFKNINNIYKNTRLVLVGKLVERFSLADKLLYNNIIHIPQVQNAIPYIDAMDIIVSYSNNEVLPMNLIEAGLCGKPVLATNVGGTGDIVEDGVTGFIINKNDVKMGIIKLRTLIESKDLRISMGERAREKCCRQFNDDVTFPLFTDCINKIIE
jgi:glycosyltransferase involved in cell wall biosynthesis